MAATEKQLQAYKILKQKAMLKEIALRKQEEKENKRNGSQKNKDNSSKSSKL